jgi:hypothetical protein
MMVNDQQLQCYKDEYSGHKLIYVRFANEDFVFRTLTVKEYETILKLYTDQFKQETAICNMGCVYPEGYEFAECEFGVMPSVIAGYLKKLSAFDSPQDIFDEYDMAKASSNLYQQCMDLIKAFIGDYTYEEMEDWTWQKLMDMTVRAENIANLQGYNYHIERTADADKPKPSIHNQEDVDNAINRKVNPLILFQEELQKEVNLKNNVVDNPFIIGKSWNNKELLDGFRKQKITPK